VPFKVLIFNITHTVYYLHIYFWPQCVYSDWPVSILETWQCIEQLRLCCTTRRPWPRNPEFPTSRSNEIKSYFLGIQLWKNQQSTRKFLLYWSRLPQALESCHCWSMHWQPSAYSKNLTCNQACSSGLYSNLVEAFILTSTYGWCYNASAYSLFYIPRAENSKLQIYPTYISGNSILRSGLRTLFIKLQAERSQCVYLRLTGFETVGISLHHAQASQVKASIYYLKFVMEEGATTVGAGRVWIATGCDPNLKARLSTSWGSPRK